MKKPIRRYNDFEDEEIPYGTMICGRQYLPGRKCLNAKVIRIKTPKWDAD